MMPGVTCCLFTCLQTQPAWGHHLYWEIPWIKVFNHVEHAIYDTSLTHSPYYAALAHPKDQHSNVKKLNLANLKQHAHNSWEKITEKIKYAETEKETIAIAKESGIWGMPAMSRVFSLHFGHSIPWDWMHLMENIVSNLISMWMGTFKKFRWWSRGLYHSRWCRNSAYPHLQWRHIEWDNWAQVSHSQFTASLYNIRPQTNMDSPFPEICNKIFLQRQLYNQ